MRWLVPLLIPLALYGSGCSLPVGAQEQSEPAEQTQAMALADFVATDATQAVIALRDAGLTYRLHPSARGAEGVVLNQVPKAGQPVKAGTTVDLVIGGDQRVIDMITIAVQPAAPASPTPTTEDELAAIREAIGDKYVLTEAELAKVEVPSLEGLHHENLPPVPVTDPSPVPQRPTVPDSSQPSPMPAVLEAEPVTTDTARTGEETATSKAPHTDAAQTPDGIISLDQTTVLTGPQMVTVGAWQATLPGPTISYEREVQGTKVTGAATRTGEGKTVSVGCAPITTATGENLPAGMVDQLLLGAPYRYGEPQRSGRYSSAQMPAVSSIIPTGNGPVRVVTWYGYGHLCDVAVPVDGQGRSDQILDPILASLRPA